MYFIELIQSKKKKTFMEKEEVNVLLHAVHISYCYREELLFKYKEFSYHGTSVSLLLVCVGGLKSLPTLYMPNSILVMVCPFLLLLVCLYANYNYNICHPIWPMHSCFLLPVVLFWPHPLYTIGHMTRICYNYNFIYYRPHLLCIS